MAKSKSPGKHAKAVKSKFPEEFEDEVDKFHKARDKLSLVMSDSDNPGSSEEDEPVFDLEASEDDDDFEDEDSEDEEDDRKISRCEILCWKLFGYIPLYNICNV